MAVYLPTGLSLGQLQTTYMAFNGGIISATSNNSGGNQVSTGFGKRYTALEALASGLIANGVRIRTSYDASSFGGWIEGEIIGWSGPGDNYFRLKNCVDANSQTTSQWSVTLSNGSTWVEIQDNYTQTANNVTLERVVMSEEKKEQIKAALSQVEHQKLIFETWGFAEVFEKGTAIAFLFHGVPGTGKTLTAQAIANELKLKLKIIQSGEIESSEPGQAERNLKAFFENAVQQKQLLLFDECDSLINDRNEVGMILGAQINALLTGLENFAGVCIFTTNRLGKMDPAFERRVSAKIEFPFPNEEQREAIWHSLIPKKAPLSKKVDFNLLAKFPIAGGNIKNVVLNAARQAAYLKKPEIDLECFTSAIEKEIEGLKDFEAAFESQTKVPRLRGDGMSRGITRKADRVMKMDKTITAKGGKK